MAVSPDFSRFAGRKLGGEGLLLLLLGYGFLLCHSYISFSIHVDALALDRVTYVYGHGRPAEVLAAADKVPADADCCEAGEDDGGVVHGFGCDGEAEMGC